MKYMMSSLEVFSFCNLVYLTGNLQVHLATKRKSLCTFDLQLLATTCESVWPGLYNASINVKPEGGTPGRCGAFELYCLPHPREFD